MNLEQLAELRLHLKAAEDAAVERRRDIDTKIVELLNSTITEGTCNETTDSYKVKVQFKVSRKVDTEKLQSCWPTLSEFAQKAFKWSADVSATELKKLQENRPDDYKMVATLITTKPAAPYVTVEPITKE